MSLEEDLYCKVYADVAMTRGAFVAWLANQLGAVVDGWAVVTPEMEVQCFESDVYDPLRCDEPKGFLYFRFYLEIYPEEPI